MLIFQDSIITRCGQCIHYHHVYFHDWSSSDIPFVTSMTICEFASDGFFNRGVNCVSCDNFVKKKNIPFFDFSENIGEQLSLF